MFAASVLTALASAVRTATQTFNPASLASSQAAPAAQGGSTTPSTVPTPAGSVVAYLNVTVAPGADTVLLKMQEMDPVSGTWTDLAGAATLAQVATGLIKLTVGPSIATVAAAVTGVSLQAPVPPFWRLQVVHSGAGNFTYSLAVAIELSRT